MRIARLNRYLWCILRDIKSYFYERIITLYHYLISHEGDNSLRISRSTLIRGRGKLVVGSQVELKNSELLIGAGSEISLGNFSYVGNKATIQVGINGHFVAGENFFLANGARVFSESEFIFGSDVKIETFCAIFPREPEGQGNLLIGNCVRIGDYSIIDVTDDVTIGNNVAIGPFCIIYSHDHDYSRPNEVAWKAGVIRKNVVIKSNVWVGANVIILPGIVIGEGAIIAAGAIVTKNVGDYELWAGVPARYVKKTRK